MVSQATKDGLEWLGLLLLYTGVISMWLMALVTILVLCAMSQTNHHGRGGDSNFLLGFALGILWADNNNCHGHCCYGRTNHNQIIGLMLVTFFMSILAIALLCAYGFGPIGIGLAIAWGGAFVLTLAGMGLYSVAGSLRVAPQDTSAVPQTDVVIINNSINNSQTVSVLSRDRNRLHSNHHNHHYHDGYDDALPVAVVVSGTNGGFR